MTMTGGRLRLCLFATTVVVLYVNALGLWGDTAAMRVYTALQAITGVAALTYALVVARRVRGKARTWRLLCVAAFSSWLLAEALWWSAHNATSTGTA
ncbi:MAG: GGDEF-domain containing protein, partial [Mycobacterium sp.]